MLNLRLCHLLALATHSNVPHSRASTGLNPDSADHCYLSTYKACVNIVIMFTIQLNLSTWIRNGLLWTIHHRKSQFRSSFLCQFLSMWPQFSFCQQKVCGRYVIVLILVQCPANRSRNKNIIKMTFSQHSCRRPNSLQYFLFCCNRSIDHFLHNRIMVLLADLLATDQWQTLGHKFRSIQHQPFVRGNFSQRGSLLR